MKKLLAILVAGAFTASAFAVDASAPAKEQEMMSKHSTASSTKNHKKHSKKHKKHASSAATSM